MRDLIAIESDCVIVPYLLNGHVRQNIVVRVRRKDLAWPRIQRRNEVRCPLHLIDSHSQPPGDLWKLLSPQILQIPVDNPVLEAVFFAQSAKLDQEAFAQIVSTDADWMKRLDQLQHWLQVRDRDLAGRRDVLERDRQKAEIVDASDD